MKHYLVTGRLWGDSEDTHLSLQMESREAAINAYIEYMWEAERLEEEDRAKLESNGQGVFVNGVFESETEIEEST